MDKENSTPRHLTAREITELQNCPYFVNDLMGTKKQRPEQAFAIGQYVTCVGSSDAYQVIALHRGYVGLDHCATHAFRVMWSGDCTYLNVSGTTEKAANWFDEIIKENSLTEGEKKAKRQEQYLQAKWWMAQQREEKKREQEDNHKEDIIIENKFW